MVTCFKALCAGGGNVTFGLYTHSLAGLLIVVRLWVCLRDVRRVVMATHADRAGTVSAAI